MWEEPTNVICRLLFFDIAGCITCLIFCYIWIVFFVFFVAFPLL